MGQLEDWDDLRFVLLALRLGSTSRVAGALDTSVSTISRRLAAIEARVGVALFARTPDGLEPTAAALALRPLAEQAEQAALGVDGALAALHDEPAGVVRVTMTEAMGARMVVPALDELLTRWPRLTVELDVSSTPLDLERREADLAIRAARPSQGDNLIATRLRDAPYAVYVRDDRREVFGTAARLEDGPWLRWGGAHNPVADWYDELPSRAHLALRTESVSVALAAAEAGLGLVLLPVSLGHCAPRLVQVPWPRLPAPTPLWLVTHASLREVPRVRVVWEFLDDLFRAQPGQDEAAALRARLRRAYGVEWT